IYFNKDESYVRYVDVLHNAQPQEQKVAVMIQSSSNYGVNSAQMIADPKKQDQPLGWVAQTGAGRCVVETFGGKGGKNIPAITWEQGNNQVQAQMQVTIPAGKDVAIMHVHSTAANMEAGGQFITSFRASRAMMTMPAEIRRIVVNFP